MNINKRIVLILSLFVYLFTYPLDAKQSEKIIAVVPKYFPPQYSLDEDGKPTGFAIDVFNKIAKNLNYDVEYIVKDTWPQVNNYILQGKADVIPNIGITKKREKYLFFTAPVESFNIGIYGRASNEQIVKYKDLNGKKLGIVEFNIGVKLSKQFDKSKKIVYKTKEEMFYALLSAEVDFVIYPIPVFNKMISSAYLEDTIIQIGKPIKEIKRAVSVSKHNQKLYKEIDSEVDKFIKTKEYEIIYSKWYGKDDKKWSNKSVVNFFIILVIIFIITLFIYKYYFTKNINAKLKKELDYKLKEIVQKDELMISQSRQVAMGEILEMIAHQWRQPLAVVQMAINNLKADLELGNEITIKQLDTLVGSVTKQTDSLSKVIDTFTTFSLQKRGKEIFLISKIIEETINLLKIDFNKHNIKFEFDNTNDTEVLILKNELMQVLLSIINNAKEALLSRGIKNSIINIIILKDQESIKINISDNAGGILKDDIKQIAQPYFSTKSLNSSGLGLYIANMIVQKHLNGKLSWKNIDNGACFTILIPIVIKENI